MDYKLQNRIDEVNEMRKMIFEAENLEIQILSKGQSVNDNTALAEKFRDKVKDIRFERNNFIQAIKYIKIENDEEFKNFSDMVEFVRNAKYCEFDDNTSSNLIDNLLSLDCNYDLEINLYCYNLIKKNKSYFENKDGNETLNLVAQALRDAKTTNTSNPVVDMFFNDYYQTRKLIELADLEDWNYGASYIDYISNDYDVEEKYEKLLKRAYKGYVFENKYQNMNLKSRVAIGTGNLISLPIKMVSSVLKLGLVCIDLVGMTFKFVGKTLAYPFEKAEEKIQMKLMEKDLKPSDISFAILSDRKNERTAAKIVGLPGRFFKGAGNLADIIARVSTSLIDIGIDIAKLPFDFLVKVVKKFGDVEFKDKVEGIDNKIKKNLKLLLKENNRKADLKFLKLEEFSVEDEKLSVKGSNLIDNYSFKIDYKIDKNTAKNIEELQNYQRTFLKQLINSTIETNQTDEIEDKNIDSNEYIIQKQIDEDFGFGQKNISSMLENSSIGKIGDYDSAVNDYNDRKEKFDYYVFSEAQIISNITTQKPLKIEFFEEIKNVNEEISEETLKI